MFNIFFIILSLILIFNIGNIKILVPYFVGTILFIYLFYKIFKKTMVMIGNRVATYSAKVSESVIDSANLYLEKKLKNLKGKFFKRYFINFDYLTKQRNLQEFLNALPGSIIELSVIIFFIFFLIYNLNFEKDSQLIFEEFFIILATLARILPSLSLVQKNINIIYFSKRSLENINDELLILKKKKFKGINKTNFEEKKINSLELKNISFGHNKKSILQNVSFKINKGQIVGIMGKSGVGKSTLGLIIAGILKPKSGLIKVNNHILKKNKKIYLNYGNIGYVSQNIHLLNDTLKNNITFSFGDKINISKYNKSIEISNVKSFTSNNNIFKK